MRLFEGTPFDIPPCCDHCGKLESECQCTPAEKARIAPNRQTAMLRVEKRKNGRQVTVIRGLLATANDLPAVLVQLKNACGAGGTVSGDEIEIQGSHIPRMIAVLHTLGYKTNPKS
jgi:translation initiation factor 1